MKRILSFILVAVLMISLCSCGKKGPFIGTIEDEKVRVALFNYFLYNVKEEIIFELKITDEALLENFWETDIDGKSAHEFAKEKAFEEVMAFEAKYLKATEAGFGLNEEYEKESLKQYEDVVKAYGGPEKFKEFLISINSDEDALLEMVQKNYCINKFLLTDNAEYIEKTTVTEQEIFDRILEKYGEDGPVSSVNIKHILIPIQDEEEKESQKQLAQDIYDRILNGEDINGLIMEYSSESAEYEGNPDGIFIRPNDMSEQVLKVVLSLEDGEICEPFETEHGFYIIQLIKKNITYLNEVKDQIEAEIKTQKEIQLGIEWKAEYTVVKNEEEYNKI